MPKLSEEEKQARVLAREAQKKAKEAEREKKREEKKLERVSTTVEKQRKFEADFEAAEKAAAEARKMQSTVDGERKMEIAEKALSAEEKADKKIQRMHDFYDVFADKSGQVGIRINNYKLINMLRDMGFYRYDQDGGTFEYVKIRDNKITLLRNEGQEIIDHFEDYVRNLPDCQKLIEIVTMNGKVQVEKAIYPAMIMEKMYNNLKQYFSTTLPRLRPIPGGQIEDISTVHDTKDSKYIFFRNTALRISNNGIEEIPYNQLDKYIHSIGEDNGKYIWDSSIIDRDFYRTESTGMFDRFITCICGLGSYPDKQIISRKKCLQSILGYLMHDNYDCNLKAVVFTDSIQDQGSPSGGTGKGILGKALGNILNKHYGIDTKYISVPGKGFDCGKDTRYSSGDITTQLIHIEDTERSFDFEKLYCDVTDGAIFRKLHHDPTYHKTKIMISTNNPFDITAPSTKRRVAIFELYNFFNQDRTPEDVLGGRMFESNWTTEDWLAYDNFMVECSLTYMQNGLIDQGEINYSENYLKNELRPEFKSWFEDYIKEGYTKQSLTVYGLEDMWRAFVKRYPDIYNVRNSFTMAIKKWLRVKQVPSGIKRMSSDVLLLYPGSTTENMEWIYRWTTKK